MNAFVFGNFIALVEVEVLETMTMKNKLLTFTVIMLSFLSSLQAQFGSQIPSTEDCLINAETAIQDIKNDEARLLLIGGIAPVIYGGEDSFESDYSLKYHDFGCMPPSSMACLMAYNKEIFKHLDATYGDKWKESIREDVIGLKGYIMPFAKIFEK